MKNPLLTGASTLVKMANDGNIKVIDNLASKIDNIDLSKLTKMTVKKRKQVTDAKKLSKEIRENTKKLSEEKSKVNNLLGVYESIVLMLDEYIITLAIENDVNVFLSSPVYQTPTDFVKTHLLPKKKYNTMSDKINDYQIVKQDYNKFIQKLRKTENDINAAIKRQQQTANKLEQLNNSIDKLRE